MTQPQTVVHDLLSFTKKNLWWHPYDETLFNGLLGAMKLFHGRKLKARLSGLIPLLRILPRVFR